MIALYVSNDNLFEVVGLKDAADNSAITSGTITVTLVDSAGTQVTGETWPLAMSHVGAGLWRATLVDTLSLTAGNFYTAQVSANAGAGKLGYWEVVCRAENRS